MTDMRNDVAKARDEWMLSNEGCRCLDGITSGRYLQNRLEAAFITGWNAREKKQAHAEATAA